MGIINWLFGKTDEVHTPPPLDRAPSDPVNRSQRQEPASLTGAPHQPLSRTQIEKLASVHGVSAGAIATLAEALGALSRSCGSVQPR